MPTTPADLLAELHAAIAPPSPEGPDSARIGAAGAAAALGGYLARLYRYSPPSDDADVITQWIPDRQIAELAIACRALGQVASGGPHRLIDLAGGFADAAAITSAHATRDQRWAFAVATVEEIDHLATLVAAANPIGTGARARADRVRAAALPIHQRAARQPPTRAANALLDAPIPDAGIPWPPRTQNTAGVAIDAAMATLLAGTRPSAQPLTIAEVLAIAMAAHSLCRAVDDAVQPPGPARRQAWSGVRASLAPFSDGSRRDTTPPHGISLPPAASTTSPRTLHPSRHRDHRRDPAFTPARRTLADHGATLALDQRDPSRTPTGCQPARNASTRSSQGARRPESSAPTPPTSRPFGPCSSPPARSASTSLCAQPAGSSHPHTTSSPRTSEWLAAGERRANSPTPALPPRRHATAHHRARRGRPR
jgi:hypothetical protein